MKAPLTLVAGLLSLFTCSQAIAETSGVQVENPWIRAAPPVVKILAAYMTIENKSSQKRTLLGADSPGFDRIEIHNTVIEDGLARMLRQKQIEIPPQGTITFSPGGYHFMLLGRKASLEPGDRVKLNLIFKNGDRLTVSALVSRGMEMQSEGMDHSKHGGHH
ncbi:MAG: copper chaperone PCu(A)C [Gammaproteobacteria bacterium]|nr:copper chaperone PCu(A)C [Gammaproteobacteria bacterium]